MSNWKNVNNWHWTGKNCLPWTKSYFEEQLKGTIVKDSSGSVEITKVSIVGECDLNQRKGALISIYELELRLEWTGKPALNKENVAGVLIVPEICQDTCASDYVFKVELSNTSRSSFGLALLNLAQKKLVEQVKSVILSFPRALVDRHMQDVHIDPKNIAASTEVSSISKPTKPKIENSSNESTGSLSLQFDFYAPASDVYKVLTDAKLITIWSRCHATFVPAPGLPFKLFSSTIKGTIDSVVKYKEIVLSWRSQGWPEGLHSNVTISFNDVSNSKKGPKKMVLTITQKEIPNGWEVNTERHWRDEVVAPIISTFMFGEPSDHIGVRALRTLASLPLYATAGFGITASALLYFYFASRN